MQKFVTDTMAIVRRIERKSLGPEARSIFDSVEKEEAVVYIPSMVFAEIMYCSEKGRMATTLVEIDRYMERFPNYKEYPIDFKIVQEAERLTIPELHDRLIAATASFLGTSLITNDPIFKLQACQPFGNFLLRRKKVSTKVQQNLIQEITANIQYLPETALAQILDFTKLINARLLTPEEFKEEMENVLLRMELKQISRQSEAHLLTEVESDYKQN